MPRKRTRDDVPTSEIETRNEIDDSITPHKRSRVDESPLEIRNEIDGEFMARHFKIDENRFWIPLHLNDMFRVFTRETVLSENEIDLLWLKSMYTIDLINERIMNTRTKTYLTIFTSTGYKKVHIFGNNISIHSIIAIVLFGLKPSIKCSIDHIDRNCLNNSRTNLRYATSSLQAINQTRPSHTRSKQLIEGFNFNEDEYIHVKRYSLDDVIYPFKPTRETKSIHISKNGNDVIINKTHRAVIGVTKIGYPYIFVNRDSVLLHRLVMLNISQNDDIPKVVDHIDGNRLNWAVRNLRACTQADNIKFAAREQKVVKNRTWVHMKHQRSGDIMKFESKIQCAEYLGVKYTKLLVGEIIGDYEIIACGNAITVGRRHPVICNGIKFESKKRCADYISKQLPALSKIGVYTALTAAIKNGKDFHGFRVVYDV